MTVYADLLRYRELFSNLFRRDFQAKYKGSLLGVFWSLLNPLVLLGVYLLVFGVIFARNETPRDAPVLRYPRWYPSAPRCAWSRGAARAPPTARLPRRQELQ